MNTFLHIRFDELHFNKAGDSIEILVQGEINHAHNRILQISWLSQGEPWLLYGFEAKNSVLKHKLLQPQAAFCGFMGLCQLTDIHNAGFEVFYESGESEKILFKDYTDFSMYHRLGNSDLNKSHIKIISQGIPTNADTLVVLPTYQADLGFLFEQVDSIRSQTYEAWHCLIIDDCSDENFPSYILRLLGNDERFTVYRNKENIGFYLNIERALEIVDSGFLNHDFTYISLADQDDVWYPNKLEKSVESLKSDLNKQLVFCDQKIVDEDLQVLQESFWKNREMDINNLDKLLMKNSVTGAAVVFRSEILKDALPFPTGIGKMYHDHWLGLVAFLSSGIEFIPDSLYAYRQHALQDTGFTDIDQELADKIQNNLIRANSIAIVDDYIICDQLSLDILSHDLLRLATLTRVLDSRFSQSTEDLNIFMLNNPESLFKYLKSEGLKQVEGVGSISTLGEETYLLASAILSCFGDGVWRKMKSSIE